MNSKKELAYKKCIQQLTETQENVIACRQIPLEERIEFVNYIGKHKKDVTNKMNSENKVEEKTVEMVRED